MTPEEQFDKYLGPIIRPMLFLSLGDGGLAVVRSIAVAAIRAAEEEARKDEREDVLARLVEMSAGKAWYPFWRKELLEMVEAIRKRGEP